VVCLGLSIFLGKSIPVVTQSLFHAYGQSAEYSHFLLLLLAISLGEFLVKVFYTLAINQYAKIFLLKIRSYCYQTWMEHQEIRFENVHMKDDFPLGEILARILNDTEAFKELVTNGSLTILMDIAFIGSCLWAFVKIHPVLGMNLGAIEVLVCALLYWGSKRMAAVFFEVRVSNGLMSRSVANLIGGVRENFFYPTNPYIKNKSEKVFDDFLKIQLRANMWDAAYYSVAASLLPIFLAIMVVIIPIAKVVELAIVGLMIDLVQRSIGPIKDFASKISGIQRSLTGVKRTDEFLNALSSGEASGKGGEAPRQDLWEGMGSFVKFSVDIPAFNYRQNEGFGLRDISFEGRPGELIGVVGPSGSGKSTLLSILGGGIIPINYCLSLEFEKIKFSVSSGPGKMGENNVLSDIGSYRHLVSFVAQDSHVFSASLMENILLSFDSMEIQRNGAEQKFFAFWGRVQAQIPYLKTWGYAPYDTVDGRRLSSGQKQLIEALRSLYHHHPVVLFDEIASGMDPMLESSLRSMIKIVQMHSLTIVVAHRLETVLEANRILVFEGGRIQGQGTHEVLLQESALYRELVSNLFHATGNS
jgi:ATP-binding cassette subfamily B multidrug efflux pump